MSTSIPVAAAPPTSPGRGLVWLSLLLGLLGPALYILQFRAEWLVTPWYVPILGTLAAVLAVLAMVQRRGIGRIVLAVALIALAVFEWAVLTKLAKLPDYAGPIAVGQPFPAFRSALADGTPIDQTAFTKDKTPTLLVFFRGRWCAICMAELSQLDKAHESFAKRKVRVVAVSLDPRDDAEKTQKRFPHLTIVADTDRKLINAAGVLHEKANPNGDDAAAPTTVILDTAGIVRWLHRPTGVFGRLAPAEILAEIDRLMPEPTDAR